MPPSTTVVVAIPPCSPEQTLKDTAFRERLAALTEGMPSSFWPPEARTIERDLWNGIRASASGFSYLRSGAKTYHLIPLPDGKIYARSCWKGFGFGRLILEPLELLAMLPYFPGGSRIAQDILDLISKAAEETPRESLTPHELWSAWGDALDEANRLWNEGDRDGARQAEARATDFRVRHQALIFQLKQQEVDRAA